MWILSRRKWLLVAGIAALAIFLYREAVDDVLHDLERDERGLFGRPLDCGAPEGFLPFRVLRKTVRLHDLIEGVGVPVDQFGEARPEVVGLVKDLPHLGFRVGVLLLPDRQVADHRRQRGTERTGKRGDAAAAGRRRI